MIGAFVRLRAHELAHLPPSRRATEIGVCDGNEARRQFFDTVDTVIIPGLEAHGIPAKAAWERSLHA